MSALINGHDEDVRVSVPGRSGTRPGTRRVPARGSGRQPRGSRIGDVTSGRIVRGGLARIERGRIVSRWARTARGGMDCVALGSHYASRELAAPDSARTASGPTTRASQIPAPSHPVSAGSTRTCLDPRERLPGIRSRGSPTISRPGRRPRCGGADEGRGGVRPARQQDRRERAHRHQPGSPHGRGDETSALTTRTRFTSSRPSPRRLFSGLMVALSCSDHSCAVGPRWSDPRSRGRDARLGVRGAAAPGAAVREIAG